MNRFLILAGVIILVLGVVYWGVQKGRLHEREPAPVPAIRKISKEKPVEIAKKIEPERPMVVPTPPPPVPPKKVPPKEVPVVEEKPVVQPPREMMPPPVEIHEELIPPDIEIVRVYYEQDYTGPGSSMEFDINGSGFTKEFERMIRVDSGHPKVKVKNLKLKTLNQIHGTLVIAPDAPTVAVFPQILIGNKVVFRAPQHFAIIRPGEVFNLVFTEMGESGRTGRIRVLTNLNDEMLKEFSIVASTDRIWVNNIQPDLPFLVDATINVGPAPKGQYGLTVSLGEKTLWERTEVINVVVPNLEDTGLIHRLFPVDGFHRPEDEARFVIQGSGFRPRDTDLLTAQVDGFDYISSTFVYLSPGRMELVVALPWEIEPGYYTLLISQGDETILETDKAFMVVDPNWTRLIRVEPALIPGGSSKVILEGRDLTRNFVSSIQVEVDEPALQIGVFQLDTPNKASAEISAGRAVRPGDYWLRMSAGGAPVTPHFGSIIRVDKKGV